MTHKLNAYAPNNPIYRADVRAMQAQAAAWSASARFNVECMSYSARQTAREAAYAAFKRQALRAQQQAAEYTLMARLAMDE